jgi:hypothetical protein
LSVVLVERQHCGEPPMHEQDAGPPWHGLPGRESAGASPQCTGRMPVPPARNLSNSGEMRVPRGAEAKDACVRCCRFDTPLPFSTGLSSWPRADAPAWSQGRKARAGSEDPRRNLATECQFVPRTTHVTEATKMNWPLGLRMADHAPRVVRLEVPRGPAANATASPDVARRPGHVVSTTSVVPSACHGASPRRPTA